MDNKNLLPSVRKDGFFNKIKILFKSIFYKQPKLMKDSEKNIEPIKENGNVLSFNEKLKVKIDNEKLSKERELRSVVEKIEENPEHLKELTIEQLEDINEYYIEKIKEVDQEIDRLKKFNVS